MSDEITFEINGIEYEVLETGFGENGSDDRDFTIYERVDAVSVTEWNIHMLKEYVFRILNDDGMTDEGIYRAIINNKYDDLVSRADDIRRTRLFEKMTNQCENTEDEDESQEFSDQYFRDLEDFDVYA